MISGDVTKHVDGVHRVSPRTQEDRLHPPVVRSWRLVADWNNPRGLGVRSFVGSCKIDFTSDVVGSVRRVTSRFSSYVWSRDNDGAPVDSWASNLQKRVIPVLEEQEEQRIYAKATI